ncbi:MAG: Metallo-beta-lactamase L1 precursor [Spirochaetes bacterium ADurb.Bin110]|nr:MAG: Metallo-beta-lactamase L1 precursor [Spirochaetes bacterium ADurb.Bin110]
MNTNMVQSLNPTKELERACRRPWEGYVSPFRIAPNVYYISGNDWVACYLIETNEGLILIDTAMHETLYLMLENIRKLGFKPQDIKKILLSHAHIDHIGGARALKELSGATIYIGKRDMFFLKDRRDLIGNEEGNYTCGEFEPDEFYSDDKPIILGDFSIKTISTPGHTPGCTSFFFNVKDIDGKIKHCGMHGGLGLNTMSAHYFKESGLPISLRDEFIEGLRKLDKLDVDICIPSHTNQVEILKLRDKINDNYNPYVNPSVWHDLLRSRQQKVEELIMQENSNQ